MTTFLIVSAAVYLIYAIAVLRLAPNPLPYLFAGYLTILAVRFVVA